MAEDLDPSPKQSYVPTDEELDASTRKFVDPFLTDEELQTLLYQDGHGITPAPQREYSGIEDFKKGQNNFHAYFDISNKGIGPMYRRRKAFQRLLAINPELVDRVVNDYKKHREGDPFSEFSEMMWSDLYEAYQQMSRLVDVDDNYVVRADTGQLDDLFLIR